MKALVLGSETVDFDSLLSHENFQVMKLSPHFIPHPRVFVLATDASLVFGEDPRSRVLFQFRTPITPRADKAIRGLSTACHSTAGLVSHFEDFPVQIGEFLELQFELLMTTRHSPNFINHRSAYVFGSCFTVFLERQ
jgi:hypothetical protein